MATVVGYAAADAVSGNLAAAIDGFAAGALLVMLIDSMIPDARTDAGRTAGLVTVLGFALAAGLSATPERASSRGSRGRGSRAALPSRRQPASAAYREGAAGTRPRPGWPQMCSSNSCSPTRTSSPASKPALVRAAITPISRRRCSR